MHGNNYFKALKMIAIFQVTTNETYLYSTYAVNGKHCKTFRISNFRFRYHVFCLKILVFIQHFQVLDVLNT